MTSGDVHRRAIAQWLLRMGVTPRFGEYRVLSSAYSGAQTYRIALSGGDAVLKVVTATSPRYVRERAERELGLYSHLARHVPVRTPQVLASHRDDEYGIALLLSAYRPCDPAGTWSLADLMQLAEEVAALHAAYWRKDVDLVKYPWLARREAAPSAEEIEGARAAWEALRRQERLRDAIGEGSFRSICGWLTNLGCLGGTGADLPLTLCHGDCHIGNLLRDADGTLIWADWQEVRMGVGPEDLSLLLQRAFPEGGGSLQEEMVGAYHRRLVSATGERVALRDVLRAMDRFELRTRLLQWPHYLEKGPEAVVAVHVRRIEQLVQRV